MKKIFTFFVFVISLFSSFSTSAGLTQLTHVSRANCYNNESVSWQANVNRTMSVKSTHYFVQGNMYNWSKAQNHAVSSNGYLTSWRVGAVHWQEGNASLAAPQPLWYAVGNHWIKNGVKINSVVSTATDCNKWDGWW